MGIKNFNLDYLTSEKRVQYQEGEKPSRISVDNALLLYSRPILDILERSPDKEAHLHDIARDTDIDIKEIMKIIPMLEAQELIKVLEHDTTTGNDLIKLTYSYQAL